MKITKQCVICSTVMYVHPCLKNRKKTCSVECRAKYVASINKKSMKTFCSYCGKELTGKSRLTAKYCDRMCMKKAFMLLNPSKPTARRWCHNNVVLNTDCEKCGSRRELQRHHQDIENEPRTAQTLCRKCRISLHIQNRTWGTMQHASIACVV